MATNTHAPVEISPELIDAIRTFPVERETEHCGRKFSVSSFDFYAACPQCGTRFKLRGFSGVTELEDVFDAVFEWMNNPLARAVADRRQAEIADDDEG
jgi:hypothetical protein